MVSQRLDVSIWIKKTPEPVSMGNNGWPGMIPVAAGGYAGLVVSLQKGVHAE
jgi:hypothetical protein